MKTMKVVVAVSSLFAATLIFQCRCTAQTTAPPATQSEPQTQLDERGTVKSEEFVNSRPGGKNPKAKSYLYRNRVNTKPTPPPPKSKKGATAEQQPPPPKGKVFVSVGVTIGRGRPATEAEIKDGGVAKAQGKCLERRGEECVRREQLVVERISDDTPVAHGTPIQMMIEYLAAKDEAGKVQESGRLGYLYVINRVEFKDQPSAAPNPKLIFPTESTFGGDNRVLPGKTVMLPGPDRLWLITRNKTAPQEFETYIIIISPEPLKDSNGEELRPGKTAPELSGELVEGWVRRWGGAETRLDLEQGAGRLFTRKEQAAGGKPTDARRDTEEMDTDLKQDDPPPQMAFSKAIAPGGTMLVTIRLPFKDTSAAPKQ